MLHIEGGVPSVQNAEKMLKYVFLGFFFFFCGFLFCPDSATFFRLLYCTQISIRAAAAKPPVANQHAFSIFHFFTLASLVDRLQTHRVPKLEPRERQ